MVPAPSTNSPIKNQLIGILEQNVGTNTANLYRKYYEDKDFKTVLVSVSDVLSQFVGIQKKDQILNDFMMKNHITLPQ